MTDWHGAFAGSIPETYDRHLGPLWFEPYADDLVARLHLSAKDARVLELACGTGIVTRRLRARLPETASIVATDLNEPMLDAARRRQGNAPGIEWRQADATALPFSDRTFDAVVCQFGVMFFPDKRRAALEAFRVLRPGGQVLMNVWDSLSANPPWSIAHETIAGFFSSNPPDFYLVPFGFHDVAALRSLFETAGFVDVAVDTVPLDAHVPSAEHAAIGLVCGTPVLGAIQERGGDPEKIVAAVAAALSARYGDGPLRVPMQAHVVTAYR